MELPKGFRWINKPVTVIGEDFTYEATCLCSFPKSNGKVRYIVEDRGRLFIQRESQLVWMDEPKPQAPSLHVCVDATGAPSQTIGEALEAHYERNKNKEDPLGR